MGRSRREQRQEQRQLEGILEDALVAGIREGESRGLERALLSTASDVLGREVRSTASLVEREGSEEALRLLGIAAREEYPDRWKEALSGPLNAVMQAATEEAAPVMGSFTLANPKMREFFEDYTSELAANLSETSYENFERVLREAMEEGLSVADAAARLRQEIPELNKSRAELIAANETHAASISASDIQARESGVVKTQTWRATKDGRTRDSHRALDGTEVGLDEEFPGGLHPATEIRCRCYIEYGIDPALLEAESVAAYEDMDSVESVENYLRNDLGIEFPELGGSDLGLDPFASPNPEKLALANFLANGLTEAKKRGLFMPKRISVTEDAFRRYPPKERKNVPALFREGDNPALAINPSSTVYKNGGQKAGSVSRRQAEDGYWSSGDEHSTLFHELGHAAHFDSDPGAFQKAFDGGTPAQAAEMRRIVRETGQPSKYAKQSPAEFVAEVYAGAADGKQYSTDVIQLYEELGGPRLP